MSPDKPIGYPRIHPLAMPAFDAVAEFLPMGRLVPTRALKVDDDLLIFSGFSGLGASLFEADIEVVSDLPDAEIEKSAWQEVAVIWHILAMPSDMLFRFGDVVVNTAPPVVLEELNLSLRCEQGFRGWPIASRVRRKREEGGCV